MNMTNAFFEPCLQERHLANYREPLRAVENPILLSAAASIMAIIQITGLIITHLCDVKDALKECDRYMELSSSHSLLLQLKSRLSEPYSQ